MYHSRNVVGSKTSGAIAIKYAPIAKAPNQYRDVAYEIGWAKVDSLRVWERQIDALAERSEKAGDTEKEVSARRIQLFVMQQLGEIARDLSPDEWLLICRRNRPASASVCAIKAGICEINRAA